MNFLPCNTCGIVAWFDWCPHIPPLAAMLTLLLGVPPFLQWRTLLVPTSWWKLSQLSETSAAAAA
jgi:hypothetical protein